MATFTFFDAWKNVSGAGANLASDTLKLSLCTTIPATSAVAASCLIGNVTKASGGGYADFTCNAGSQWSGTSTVTLALAGADPSWTAVSTAITGVRYVVLWDDTITSPNADPLVGYWDYGSAIDVNPGETFTLDLNASYAAYTLA